MDITEDFYDTKIYEDYVSSIILDDDNVLRKNRISLFSFAFL